MAIDLPISGNELKDVRMMCGYSAREFGEFLALQGAKPTTARGIYYLEENRVVDFRYATALAKMIGQPVFEKALKLVRDRKQEREREWEASRRRWAEEKQRQEEERQRRQDERMQANLRMLEELERTGKGQSDSNQ